MIFDVKKSKCIHTYIYSYVRVSILYVCIMFVRMYYESYEYHQKMYFLITDDRKVSSSICARRVL